MSPQELAKKKSSSLLRGSFQYSPKGEGGKSCPCTVGEDTVGEDTVGEDTVGEDAIKEGGACHDPHFHVCPVTKESPILMGYAVTTSSPCVTRLVSVCPHQGISVPNDCGKPKN